MSPESTARALVAAAYDLGWRNACSDHFEQSRNGEHPIGASKSGVDGILAHLDPHDLLGLRGAR